MYWIGALLMILAAAAMVAAMVWGQVGIEITKVMAIPIAAVQAALGIWVVTFLWACGLFLRAGVGRWAVRRSLRRPGPKGEILITQNTVRELASALLREELRLTRFKVILRAAGKGVALRVALRLPPGEEIPALAERIQNLLSTEVAARTGLEVPEVRLVVQGAATRKR